MADGGWRMADGGWRMADGGWRMADGGWPPPPRKWEILGCTSKILGCTPEILGCTPEILGCTPEILGCTPEILGCRPEILGCTPEILACTPGIRGAARQTRMGCTPSAICHLPSPWYTLSRRLMAKRNPPAAKIDWYLISIDRLKQIGLVVVLLLLAAAGVWFWREQKGNPKTNAETAIAEARQALNSLAASTEYNAHRAEFNRAQQKLDEARNHFNASRYAEAQTAAVESGTISNTARTGGGAVDNDAQFLAVEGDVKVQKGSSSEWRDADLRTPLFNGDWVKTGDRSSAELIFSSHGSLYTIGSHPPLEIYATLNPGSTKKTNSVTVKVGPVEVATSKDTSTVRTPGTQVIVESDSTTQVNVNEQQASSVIATRGNASVAPEAGGAGVRLSSGEKVTATPVGAVSAVRKVAPSPLLLSPADGQSFQLSPELNVQLLWNPPEAGAK